MGKEFQSGLFVRFSRLDRAGPCDHGELAGHGAGRRAEEYSLTPPRIAAAVIALALAALVAPTPAVDAAGPTRNTRTIRTQASRGLAAGGPDAHVLELALSAASCATQALDVKRPSLLTVIDYSRPSTQPRLWVLDLASRRQLFRELVAHGRGSGDDRATRFSNDFGSHQSSLGLFLTGETYTGSNGYSLRLDGLEPGVNDRARERAIVMHGAPYVSASITRTVGRLGRSWGCPALSLGVARDVIDVIKDGSLVFVYYPDQRWQQGSRFLGSCGSTTRQAALVD